jgi:hypothetical protein
VKEEDDLSMRVGQFGRLNVLGIDTTFVEAKFSGRKELKVKV